MTTDNSVLFALNELRDLEETRIASEEAARKAEREAREAARAKAREAAERAAAEKAAEAAHAAQVAMEEARLNVDAQIATRTEDAESRINAMKAEIAAIQAEREALHLRMFDRDQPAPRSRGWAAAFGVAMVACAGLAALVTVQLTATPVPPQVVIREVEVPVAVAAVEAPAEPETVAVVTAEPELEPSTARRNTMRQSMHETMRDRTEMAFERMEACGDDPLCMLD